MLKRQRGNLFQATHQGEGRTGGAKASRKNKQPALASTPPSFGRSKRKQRGLGEMYAQGGRAASCSWGSCNVAGIFFPQTEGWMHTPLLLLPQKDQGKAFFAPLSQTSAGDEHHEEDMGWKQAGSRLSFSSLSPEELNRLEDAGEEEGSGHLKAPIQLPR